ncbi:hypothetical protein KEM56_006768 [Ascosphaera pollenicola]|nr:hypothetical protein KEM56_006768 [Ascosphaera pollenicola]
MFNCSVLTVKEWENIYELYQMHFATLLPFLQPTSYRAQVRQICDPVQMNQQRNHQLQSRSNEFAATLDSTLVDQSMSGGDSTVSSLVLMGVLALTARFNTPLINYHAAAAVGPSNYSQAIFASEVYANELRNYFASPSSLDMEKPVMSRVQALLMLSLHEWGMCRGKQAWMYTGMAIRMALASDLGFEDAEDTASQLPEAKATNTDGINDAASTGSEGNDAVIEREIRRRTLWACFMLDRLVACGSKQRPRMLKVRDMNIQLPSDNAFMFGERVRSNHLNCWPKGPTPDPGRASTERETTNRQRERAGTVSNGANLITPNLPSLRQSLGLPDEKGRSPVYSNSAADARQTTWAASSGTSSASSPDTPPRNVSMIPSAGPGGPGNVNILNDTEERTTTDVDRFELGADECVLGRVIRMMRISAKIGRWVSRKRSKKDDPSNPASTSTRLQNHLADFKSSLSRNLQYSSRNTDIHMYSKASLPSYALMHIMYFTSVMMLHRSSLYFIPLQSKDSANSIESDYQSPYSRQQTASAPLPGGEPPPRLSDSATDRDNLDTYLRAAQQLLELVRGCHDRDVMSESPLVGWGIYQSCFAGIYAVRFGLLKSRKNPTSGSTKYNSLGNDVCAAIEILAEMRPRLKLAETWFRTLHRLHSYYGRIQQELPVGYKPLGDDEDVSAISKTFAKLGSSEDRLQVVAAPAAESAPNPPASAYSLVEEGTQTVLPAPQLSKSTPPVVASRTEGGSNLSDLAAVAGTREPFATVHNKASSGARSIAPLLQGPPQQTVGGENAQIERTWTGMSAPANPETTPASNNHVYTLPPLQPPLCVSTQPPTSASLLHAPPASNPPIATSSAYPPGTSLILSTSGLAPVSTTVVNDESKKSQSGAAMGMHGNPPSPSLGSRLQPLSSWAPTTSIPTSHSLPPLVGGPKSAPGSVSTLGYSVSAQLNRSDQPTSSSSQPSLAMNTYATSGSVNDGTIPPTQHLTTPAGMGPPPSLLQQPPSQSNLLPPLASSSYGHALHTAQSQSTAQPKHHASTTSLSGAPLMILNPHTTSRSAARSPTAPTKPATPLLNDSTLSLDLGGDDVLAFFEGAGWEQFAPNLASTKKAGPPDHYPVGANGMSRGWLGGSQGLPSGWLAVIWADAAIS